jgi:hypothetical protein
MAWVRFYVTSCEIYDVKSVTGAIFSEHLGFPCKFSFHRLFYTRLLSGAGTVRILVAGVPSGLSHTRPPQIKKKLFERANCVLLTSTTFLVMERLRKATNPHS